MVANSHDVSPTLPARLDKDFFRAEKFKKYTVFPAQVATTRRYRSAATAMAAASGFSKPSPS